MQRSYFSHINAYYVEKEMKSLNHSKYWVWWRWACFYLLEFLIFWNTTGSSFNLRAEYKDQHFPCLFDSGDFFSWTNEKGKNSTKYVLEQIPGSKILVSGKNYRVKQTFKVFSETKTLKPLSISSSIVEQDGKGISPLCRQPLLSNDDVLCSTEAF